MTHHTKVIRKEAERKEIEREMLLSKCGMDFVPWTLYCRSTHGLVARRGEPLLCRLRGEGSTMGVVESRRVRVHSLCGYPSQVGCAHIQGGWATHTPPTHVCWCAGEIDQSRLVDTRTGAIHVLHG